jgi:mannose-6-phosphate isomerase-like protein (cupin superfamily)
MYAPDPPDRGIQRTIRCQPADIEETRKARAHARAAPPREDLGYLDRLIHKPWGSEFRVYEDDVREAWCLHLGPHRRTSLHCHPNKRTALICLQGSGTLSTRTGMHYALEPGVVMQIEPGAYHRGSSAGGARGPTTVRRARRPACGSSRSRRRRTSSTWCGSRTTTGT